MGIKNHLFVLALATVILAGCNPPATGSAAGTTGTTGTGTTPVQETNAKVARRDIVGYVLFPGTVDFPADAQAAIYPPYRAPVAKVDVHQGQVVDRGQTLIEMALPDQKVALQQAQDNLKAAQTAYANADAQYGAPVRDAKHALDAARSTERAARSAAAQSGDATQVDQATQQRQAAEEALLQAQAGIRANMLPYQQQLDAARASYNDAKAGFKQTLIKAPISGTVVDLKAQAGQEIGADAKEVIVKIMNYGAITVRGLADMSHRDLLSRGTKVVFALADRSKPPIDGVVRRVRDVPGTNGGPAQLEVTIDFKNDGSVTPTTVIRWAGVKTRDVKGVLAVPVGAVTRDATGKPVVKVLEGQDWKDHVVEVGVSDGDWIEIKDGVKEGDTVQVKGEVPA